MLDVNEYLDRTEEVKLLHKTLHVYEPTHSMYLAALQHENEEDANTFIAGQIKTVVAFLNRNKEGIKLKESEIADLPRSFVVEVYRTCMFMCAKALSDPNSCSRSQTIKE